LLILSKGLQCKGIVFVLELVVILTWLTIGDVELKIELIALMMFKVKMWRYFFLSKVGFIWLELLESYDKSRVLCVNCLVYIEMCGSGIFYVHTMVRYDFFLICPSR
jgi:hypothetical protein